MKRENKKPIHIDLDRFKLHVKLTDGCELSLHFNTPSRRFYLSLIALLVNEMKKLGRIASISLEEHCEVLALLNETIGASAGSSERQNLLQRIYRKWKDALPNLEDAPLFKVLGRKKEYGDGVEKTYPFSDKEKDAWANLFDYKGSVENVRLRFSLDRIGADLKDVAITYGEFTDHTDDDAWESFLADLQNMRGQEPSYEIPPSLQIAYYSPDLPKRAGFFNRWARWKFVPIFIALLVAACLALWRFYLRAPQVQLASPLYDKPSIAVLPFANIGDLEQTYIADGITDQIITALSKTPRLLVIARNSVFTYKDKPVKVQQISRELGVRYVLEGSLQTSKDRLRITAQLVDARTGSHIWSEKYDRQMKDIFALEDDIAMRVLKALQVKLTEGEQTRIYGRGTDNLEAYLKLQKGREHIHLHNEKDHEIAKQLFEEAIGLDPNYPTPYEFLAIAHLMDITDRYTTSPAESLKKAHALSQKLLSLDTSSAGAHRVLSFLYFAKKEYERAVAEARRAIELDPNDADGYAFWALALTWSGRYKQAISQYEKAIVLNPLPPSWYLADFGRDYFWTGQTAKAIEVFRGLAHRDPRYARAYGWLGFSLLQAGRPGEAVVEFDKAFRLTPNLPWATGARLLALSYTQSPEQAISMLRDVADCRPCEFECHRYFAHVLRKEGKYEEGLEAAKKAVELGVNQFNSAETIWTLGTFYVVLGQYNQAISRFKESVHLWPEHIASHLWLAAAYSLSGRMAEARTEIAEVHRINPSYSFEQFAEDLYFDCKKDDKKRILNALREAGLE